MRLDVRTPACSCCVQDLDYISVILRAIEAEITSIKSFVDERFQITRRVPIKGSIVELDPNLIAARPIFKRHRALLGFFAAHSGAHALTDFESGVLPFCVRGRGRGLVAAHTMYSRSRQQPRRCLAH